MRLEHYAAGHLGTWLYPRAQGLFDWLHKRPWQRRGGVCTATTTSSRLFEPLWESIRAAVHGLDCGASELAFHRGRISSSGLRFALLEALGYPVPQPLDEARDNLRRALTQRKRLFLLSIEDVKDVLSLSRDVASLFDWTRQSPTHAPLTLILIGPQEDVGLDVDGFDLRTGLPDEPIFDEARRGEDALWLAYARLRLAWEVGGCLETYESIATSMAQLTPRDDTGLERLMDASAEERLRAIEQAPAELLAALQRVRPGNEVEPTVQHQLWWPGDRPELIPQTARALLQHTSCQRTRTWLRASLVCRPLRNAILRQVLDLELEVRSDLFDGLQSQLPPLPETARRKVESLRVSISPIDWPASMMTEPEDGWTFVGFGEFVDTIQNRSSRSDFNMLRRLLKVRNIAAHNGYVCWLHVLEVARLFASLRLRSK